MKLRSMAWMVPVLVLSACAGSPDEALEDGEVDDGSGEASQEAALSADAYYSARPDFRLRCQPPQCGGVYVKRVNSAGADKEIYVSEVDLSAMHLPPAEALAAKRATVYRGTIRKSTSPANKYPVFVASEAWKASSPASPAATDIFRKLSDIDVKCNRAPCFTIQASRLNSSTSVFLSGTEGPFAVTSVVEDVLAAGTVRSVPNAGPAGTGRVMRVNQLYRRIQAPLQN